MGVEHSKQKSVPRRLVSLPDKRLTLTASIFETTQPNTLHNGKGFRIKKSQEEWLQCVCSLLPETNPRIQRGLRFHRCCPSERTHGLQEGGRRRINRILDTIYQPCQVASSIISIYYILYILPYICHPNY